MATVLRSQSAFARLFVGKTAQILNNATDLGTKLASGSQSAIFSKSYSNYAHSPFVRRIQEQYEYEIVKNPPEWKYVQRLLPHDTVPPVIPKDNYPSGWIGPKEDAKNLPYFLYRTRSHELPIYLNITYRGQRHITKVKKIDGDIWLLNDEIKQYLREKNNRYVETRVHELGRFIEAKGDYVNDLRDWAHSKGF